MDNARILVTGGCGLQGSHIVEQLISAYPNCKVFVFSRKPDINRFPGVEYIAGSTSSSHDVQQLFETARPTVVFHVAGLNANAPVTTEVMLGVNLDATRILLEESKRFRVKAFIFTSSSMVVSGVNGANIGASIENADETWPTQTEPDSMMVHPYAKAESERLVAKADTPGGMRTANIRSALIYGERDTIFIPMFMSMLEKGETATRFGDGKNIISFTYAGNSAKFQIQVAERLLSAPEGVAGETFCNVDKEHISFYDFLRTVWAAAGHEQPDESVKTIDTATALQMAGEMERVAKETGETPKLTQMMVLLATMSRYFNNAKGERVLGWKQPITQKEAVGRSVKWYLENKQS